MFDEVKCMYFRGNRRIISLCLFSFLSFIVIFHGYSNTTLRKEGKILRGSRIEKKPLKKVLIYSATKFFNMDVTTERFLSECHSTKGYCRISENPSDHEHADAILFHNADFRGPIERKRIDQPFVLWSLESPANDHFRPPSNFINWTMTYRKDADIWYPYGHIERRKEKITVDLDEIWKMKDQSLTAVWIGSNCNARNGREKYIKKMREEGMKADIFGSCGEKAPHNCSGVDKQGYDCVTQVVRPYKFYLSLENSNCIDYVTEKTYETMNTRMAVPIVLRRKYYEDLGIPSKSFISLDDFPNMKSFVEYVQKVSSNKDKYLEYHEWRQDYQVFPEHDDSSGFCELCRRLQNPPTNYKSYSDVAKWHSEKMCENEYGHDRFL